MLLFFAETEIFYTNDNKEIFLLSAWAANLHCSRQEPREHCKPAQGLAMGMVPCLKENTGREEKLLTDFNPKWGTKYTFFLISFKNTPFLLISSSDFKKTLKKIWIPF